MRSSERDAGRAEGDLADRSSGPVHRFGQLDRRFTPTRTTALIDLKHAVIMDVEATTTIRQEEVGAAKTMLDRTAEQFDVIPSRLIADGGYGSAEMIGWLVDERRIEPYVSLIDKAERTDGTLRAATSPSNQSAIFMSAPAAKS